MPGFMKSLIAFAALCLALFACAPAARAETFFISTLGEFPQAPCQCDQYLGLRVLGSGPIPVTLPPGGSVGLGQLGIVQLDTTPATYNIGLRLRVLAFTNIDEVIVFTGAAVTGGVSEQGEGSVVIDFGDTPTIFNVPVEIGPGGPVFRTYALTLNDLFVVAGRGAPITGRITDVTVPEPAAVLLLGAGLAGMVGAVRQRRKAAQGE